MNNLDSFSVRSSDLLSQMVKCRAFANEPEVRVWRRPDAIIVLTVSLGVTTSITVALTETQAGEVAKFLTGAAA